MTQLDDALAEADVVISLHRGGRAPGRAAERWHARPAPAAPRQVYVDLALPHDVDPRGRPPPGRAGHRPGAAGPSAGRAAGGPVPEVREVADLVTAEVAELPHPASARRVAPTVAALRARAAEVVDAEMARLDQRLPYLDEADRAEVHRAVHRVVEKLLHTPTVRVKELSARTQGGDYAGRPARAVRPRPQRRRRRLGPARDDRRRPEPVEAAMTACCGSAPAAAPSPPPRPAGWPTGCGRSATRSSWSRSRPRATLDRAAGQLGGTGVFVSALRAGPARRRGRPRGALAQGPAGRPRARPGRGRGPGARGPPRRRSSPATA